MSPNEFQLNNRVTCLHQLAQRSLRAEGEGPFIKAAMDEVGLSAGPPRPPARSVSPGLREELHVLFTEVGVPKFKD